MQAEPEQDQPVAWMTTTTNGGRRRLTSRAADANGWRQRGLQVTPLYTRPAAQQ